MRKLVFIVALIMALLPAAAFAQDSASGSRARTPQEVYNQLPPELQQLLVDESTEVFNYCNTRDLFAQFHDCRCVAAEFMDVRIMDYDPNVSIISVADDVADKCPYAEGAAGYAHTQCMSSYGGFMEYGLADFCECYAKKFAKFYMEAPASHMRAISRAGGRAMKACGDEGMPTPVKPYPDE